MPTYEYKREDGTTFEITQKMSDDPLKTCPDTGQKVKRIISGGGGVVYKGEGWYVTDYKDGGRKKPKPEAEPAKKKTTDSTSDAAKGKSSDSKSKNE